MRAQAGSQPVIELLRPLEPSFLNARNKHGCTALHLATQATQQEVAALLAECRADAALQDDAGCTALHYAVTLPAMGALVCTLSVDPEALAIRDLTGRNVLHGAAMAGQVRALQALQDGAAQPPAGLWRPPA